MSALDKLAEMKAAAQANVDALAALEADVKALQELPTAPVDEDLKAQLEKAKADADALVKERDALRAAIQAEIDDAKTDSDRLERAIKPVEVAPAPVIPDVPAPAPVETAPAADDGAQHNVEVQPEL